MIRLIFMTIFSMAVMSAGVSAQNTNIKLAKTHVRFTDVDPVEWTARRPWQYAVHGIDVAHFQGEIDWNKLPRAGVNFAFIKATEGGDFLDPRFGENWVKSRHAGVLRGAYHFYYFCRTAHEQANWFIRNVPRDNGSLPHVLDMEWTNSKTCKYRPNPARIRSEMRVYLQRITAHYGKRPVIYSTPKFYKENKLWRIKGYDFWLRTVAKHPSQLYGNRPWTFWQYSSTGRIPGIEDDVDLNVFRGSKKAWKRWVSGN